MASEPVVTSPGTQHTQVVHSKTSWDNLRAAWADALPLSKGGVHEAYSVTGNPFAVPAILPGLVGIFTLTALALILRLSPIPIVGALIVASVGLLLVAAVSLRGTLIIGAEGMEFRYGNQFVKGTWGNVRGVVLHTTYGLCLEMTHALQSDGKIKTPSGIVATDGNALIPLRAFGDRRFGILYKLRNFLPSEAYMPAIEAAKEPSRNRCIMIYAMTTVVCVLAILITAATR